MKIMLIIYTYTFAGMAGVSFLFALWFATGGLYGYASASLAVLIICAILSAVADAIVKDNQ